jgi:hypothetical protein
MELIGIAMIVLCGATASWLTARDHRLPADAHPPE